MARIYIEADARAFEQAEGEAATRGYIVDKHNSELLVAYFDKHPEVSITAAFVRQVMDAMHEKGLLHWKSPQLMNYEAAVKSSGLTERDLQILDSGLANYKLITAGDEGYSNKAAMIEYLRGRQVSHDEIYRGAQYLQAKGARLHWKPAPGNQTPHRGHNQHGPADTHFMPKSECNLPHEGKTNWAKDPRFNGEKERQEKREQERRMNMPHPTHEDAAWAEKYWASEIEKLIATGTTHAQRDRLRAIDRQTSGSARQRHEAVEAEANRLRREREIGR